MICFVISIFAHMYVSGFSFIRNAIKLDYPVVEAIRSILPLCDEVVVAVGVSEDETRELISGIDPKVRIVDTEWDLSLREGGRVLAIETDKAFDAINSAADWCFYIQGDECLHEKYIPGIRSAMEKWKDEKEIDGLLFRYKHFYGSYDFIGDSRTWYRNEIRVIRNNKEIRSYKDAQGFRINGKKLKVKEIDAEIYHYGWVRHPRHMMAKSLEANRYWHDDRWIEERFDPDKDFDYSQIDSIKKFEGTHPEVMKERIERMNWSFSRDPSVKKFRLKSAVLYYIEKWTGWRVGENKNYRF